MLKLFLFFDLKERCILFVRGEKYHLEDLFAMFHLSEYMKLINDRFHVPQNTQKLIMNERLQI